MVDTHVSDCAVGEARGTYPYPVPPSGEPKTRVAIVPYMIVGKGGFKGRSGLGPARSD